MWGIRKCGCSSGCLGALESVTKKLEKWSEKLVIRIEQLQKTSLLGKARILRTVLSF